MYEYTIVGQTPFFLAKSNIIQDPAKETMTSIKTVNYCIIGKQRKSRALLEHFDDNTFPLGSWVMPIQNCTVYTWSNGFLQCSLPSLIV